MTNTQTIYVELLDEGVVVYRPVEAIPDPDGVLRLPATAPARSMIWGSIGGSSEVGVWTPFSESAPDHKDLDVAVWLTDLPRIERRFASFRRVGDDESPGLVLLRDPAGRTLDLRLV